MSELLTKAGWILALLLVVMLPPGLFYWFVIHPFASYWRRFGPRLAVSLALVPCVALGASIYQFRKPLLDARWPFNWWLAAVGIGLYFISLTLDLLARRHLKVSILVGLPEVGSDPGRLLDQGIYSRTRNPRYLAILIGLIGWALILNYPGVYLVFLVTLPLLYPIMLLEERELAQRFGEEYERYRRRVPRFFPRLRPTRGTTRPTQGDTDNNLPV